MLSHELSTPSGQAPPPDMALLRQAAKAFHAGEKQAARDLLSEAAAINPQNELVWLWRASAARTRWEALEAVERVLDLNPANDKALNWIGRLRPQAEAAVPEQHAAPAAPIAEEPVVQLSSAVMPDTAEVAEAAEAAEAGELEERTGEGASDDSTAGEFGEEDDPIRRLLAGRGGYDPDLDESDSIEASLAALERGRIEPGGTDEFGGDGEPEGDVWAALGVAPPETRTAAPAAEPEPECEAKESAESELEFEAKTAVEPEPAAAADGFVAAAIAAAAPEPKPWECFVCGKMGGNQEGVCIFCRSIVDLEQMDLAARHEGTDRSQLIVALERTLDALEANPTAEGHIEAALLRLNLRESNAALPHLLAACRMRTDDAGLRAAYERLAARPLVLAVDDSKTVQKMISTVLEKERYRVVTAEDGLQALARLDDELPSLVLLDITMPRMDGYQVCKVIAGNDATRHIPVVMLSGKDGFFDKVRGKMVGASNYLTKPFDPEQLTATIGKFLRKN